MIGRKEELHKVLDLFEHNKIRLIGVYGMEGIGKTKFISEVASHVN